MRVVQGDFLSFVICAFFEDNHRILESVLHTRQIIHGENQILWTYIGSELCGWGKWKEILKERVITFGKSFPWRHNHALPSVHCHTRQGPFRTISKTWMRKVRQKQISCLGMRLFKRKKWFSAHQEIESFVEHNCRPDRNPAKTVIDESAIHFSVRATTKQG